MSTYSFILRGIICEICCALLSAVHALICDSNELLLGEHYLFPPFFSRNLVSSVCSVTQIISLSCGTAILRSRVQLLLFHEVTLFAKHVPGKVLSAL